MFILAEIKSVILEFLRALGPRHFTHWGVVANTSLRQSATTIVEYINVPLWAVCDLVHHGYHG